MNGEMWEPISGYDGRYEVSNKGRVRSVTMARLVNNRYGGKNIRTDTGREIKPIDHGNGYLYVTLHKGEERKNHFVHRLVAEAFCQKDGHGDVINHKDGDKKNNMAENLEWCTQRENVLYSVEAMKKPKTRCKPTKTGEKYIHEDHRKGKAGYRLVIRQLKIDKHFKTIEEAKAFKEEVMRYGV